MVEAGIILEVSPLVCSSIWGLNFANYKPLQKFLKVSGQKTSTLSIGLPTDFALWAMEEPGGS
jgi:hypothetical protein